MKGFSEFKGYRTRITYDPKSKEFVTRRVEYTEFNVRDAEVSTKTQVGFINPPNAELPGQHIDPNTPYEDSATPRKHSKSKSKVNRVSSSSATMGR
jgi:hypothetical protein